MERITLEEEITHVMKVAAQLELDNEKKRSENYKLLEELKSYKDLEEQGLLLKLPIPLNTTVYTIYTKQWCYYDDDCMEDIEYKCMNGEFCEKQEVRHYIHTEKFSASMINFMNKTVFLTHEEAENRLKELENE